MHDWYWQIPTASAAARSGLLLLVLWLAPAPHPQVGRLGGVVPLDKLAERAQQVAGGHVAGEGAVQLTPHMEHRAKQHLALPGRRAGGAAAGISEQLLCNGQ
jgi:hypothetical protein